MGCTPSSPVRRCRYNFSKGRTTATKNPVAIKKVPIEVSASSTPDRMHVATAQPSTASSVQHSAAMAQENLPKELGKCSSRSPKYQTESRKKNNCPCFFPPNLCYLEKVDSSHKNSTQSLVFAGTTEQKQKVKRSSLDLPNQMTNSGTNHIWDCCGSNIPNNRVQINRSPLGLIAFSAEKLNESDPLIYSKKVSGPSFLRIRQRIEDEDNPGGSLPQSPKRVRASSPPPRTNSDQVTQFNYSKMKRKEERQSKEVELSREFALAPNNTPNRSPRSNVQNSPKNLTPRYSDLPTPSFHEIIESTPKNSSRGSPLNIFKLRSPRRAKSPQLCKKISRQLFPSTS